MIKEIYQTELKRFLAVAIKYNAMTGKTAMMPSCIIDTCWHSLLENEADWAAFSREAAGCVIEHVPTSGQGIIEWVPTYEAMFGTLSPCWFWSPDALSFDQSAFDDYMSSGHLKMSWDCAPALEHPNQKPSKSPAKTGAILQ